MTTMAALLCALLMLGRGTRFRNCAIRSVSPSSAAPIVSQLLTLFYHARHLPVLRSFRAPVRAWGVEKAPGGAAAQ
jgi:hypothetical protein